MKGRVEAVYHDGFFRPVEQQPDLREGERVRLTVESVGQARPVDILDLATHVYDGLSPKDIAEVQEMARRRTFFADAPSESDEP